MIPQEYVQAALPDYDVGRELGRGGFGRVFAARHRRLDRAVAVKVLPLAGNGDGAADERRRTGTVQVMFGGPPGVVGAVAGHGTRAWRATEGFGPAALEAAGLAADEVDAEAQIVASLDHPHIVRVFDYVRTPETALIVMELLPGGTLTERARDGLRAPGACAVVAAIAVALERVHREGLLHCDIKPSNIMFTADGAPRLTDFGIARLLETSVGITQTSIVGSTPYLAPEQFEMAVPGVGVDVYSLGAVLYELLAGTPPFGADPRPHVMAERHRSAVPQPLPPRFTGLDAVTRRALAKHPTDRQPDALSFAAELCAAAERTFGPGWLANTGISFRGDDDLRRPGQFPPAPPAPPGPPAPSPPRRGLADRLRQGGIGPVAVSLGTAAVVLLIVVALLATGILHVGRDDQTTSSQPTPTPAPPIVYPVSAPLPLRGLISLAADPTGGILLTDSSQHTLTRFADGRTTMIVGNSAVSGPGASTGPPSPGTGTGTGSADVTGGQEQAQVGLPAVARDGMAAGAGLHRPAGVAAGGGSVFVADEWNCVVRRFYQPLRQPWRVDTVAGRPAAATASDPDVGRTPEKICPSGGAGAAPRAVGRQIGTPTSVAVSPSGAVYFTTGYAGQVWRIDPSTGGSGDYRTTSATLLAGDGAGGDADERRSADERRYDGSERAAVVPLDNAYAVAVDGAGRVFVLSYAGGYARIHLIENGAITTVLQRSLDEAAITTLAPAPGGRGILFTDADARTVSLLDPTAMAPKVLLRGTCVGATERLFGVAVDRAGDLYYSCNDATQATVYRVLKGDLAVGTNGRSQRVLY
ncbi:Protein kinase family protein [Frankia sp. AiPs1]|uniref:serine/threonine-protein kinase n=1 Tax=Frankia sp. AiPa1 TaxID=573492 RepID=UPI00202B006C|nr:serine/threonine-protein kinase [Frankia sp. AiPa1]MCL9758688.1 serine/threonine-protein kinase [Frankia sp. AiPa1]